MDILKHIPGFRSNKKWKMAIAILYYLISLLFFFKGFAVGLILVSPVFIVFSMIDILKNQKVIKENKKVANNLGISLLIPLVIFIGSLINVSINTKNTQTLNAKEITAETPKPTIVATIPTQIPIVEPTTKAIEQKQFSICTNVEELKNKFNEQATKNNFNYKMSNISISDNKNTFTCYLEKKLLLSGDINQDNTVRSIVLLASGDGTLKSGANIMLCISNLLSTIDLNLVPKDKGDILKELQMDIAHEGKTSTIRNGYKYSYTSSKNIGILFTIKNANDLD
mgnify:CR=1 FL=1